MFTEINFLQGTAPFESGVDKEQPDKSGLPPVSVNKVYWNTPPVGYLPVLLVELGLTLVDLSPTEIYDLQSLQYLFKLFFFFFLFFFFIYMELNTQLQRNYDLNFGRVIQRNNRHNDN